MVQNPHDNAEGPRDVNSIPGARRYPGGGNGNLVKYFCEENPMEKGAWWATVHGVTKSQTQWSTHPSKIMGISLL